MSTQVRHASARSDGQEIATLTYFAFNGARVGALAGLVMAAYSAGALALMSDRNVFWLLYGAATAVLGPGSLERAQEHLFYVRPDELLIGLGVHLAVAAMFGSLFGFLVLWRRLDGGRALTWGILFGLGAMVYTSLVAAPLLGIASPVSQQGWLLASLDHVVFGFMLGTWPLSRPQDFGRSRRRVVGRR